MAEYEWPGNVRALRHAIERATILSANESIQPDDLQLSVETRVPATASVTVLPTVLNLDQMERAAIEKSLRKHAFNISHAAKELGLTRASLYRRMEKHGI
jgi:transcriptional regulator of acetoin/glycerol metabolism